MADRAQTVFQKKSRSFSLAARFFSPATRDDVARLYQFCRYIDDLADDSAQGEPERLHHLEQLLGQGNAADDDDRIVADFLKLAKRRALPLQAARELVAASAADCGPRSLRGEDELIRFAYGVAGTVGLLMCPLLGADDAAAEPFAIDLGIALQLTNIARDVAEDADRGRFYLPAGWVAPETVQLARNEHDPGAIRAVDAAVEQTLQTADRYYESALAGHWFIPPRNRRAIFYALRFYRAIGQKLRQQGTGAWRGRTRLSLAGKVAVGCRAWPRYRAMLGSEWSQPLPPRHNRALQRPLQEAAS